MNIYKGAKRGRKPKKKDVYSNKNSDIREINCNLFFDNYYPDKTEAKIKIKTNNNLEEIYEIIINEINNKIDSIPSLKKSLLKKNDINIKEEIKYLESNDILNKFILLSSSFLFDSSDDVNIKEKYLEAIGTNFNNLMIYNNDEIDKKCECMDLEINKHTSEVFCINCGLVYEKYIDNTEQYNSYETIQTSFTNIQPRGQPYSSSEYFNSILGFTQVKKFINIPDEIIEKINNELIKQRISKNELTSDIIHNILKKIEQPKYYQYVNLIYNRITGKKEIILNKNLENKLRKLHEQYKMAFNEIDKGCRTSSLNYSFVIHKLLELVGEDDLKINYKVPKNEEKVMEYDRIWQKICKHCNWEFIATDILL